MKICVLSSGSKGNATYIETEQYNLPDVDPVELKPIFGLRPGLVILLSGVPSSPPIGIFL